MKLSLTKISKKAANLLASGRQKDATQLIASFISLNKKQKDIDLILDLVMKEYYNLTGILSVDLSLAYQKSEDEMSSIKKFLAAKLNAKNLNINLINDPSIIGGFKAKTPIAEVDCSVKNQINNLKNAI